MDGTRPRPDAVSGEDFAAAGGPGATEVPESVREVSPEAMERLRAYPWPGNIRELQSVLKRALLRATGPVLVPAFLPESLGGARTTLAATAGDEGVLRVGPFLRERIDAGSKVIYQEAHQSLDRLLLPLVLEVTEGNKLQAARLLGITRKTLRLRLRALGVSDLMAAEDDEDDAPCGTTEAGSGVIPS